jgi:SAM-dependent methyltransferase
MSCAIDFVQAAAAQTREMTAGSWTSWPLAEWADAITAEACRLAAVAPETNVLDVAGGSGEPSIALARVAKVTMVDLSAAALDAARSRAAREGITRLVLQEADAHALPFADGAFDVVTCSFGLMHFRDAALALREMRRVLAPRGRAVHVVWGSPEANAVHARTFGLLGIGGDSDLYRFAPAGALRGELRRAGFSPGREERRILPLVWRGSAPALWRFLQRVSPPLAAVSERESRVVASLEECADAAGRIVLPVEVVFVESKAEDGVAAAPVERP